MEALGLAKGLEALLDAVGVDLPASGTVLATRTIVVSLAVGILITLVASLRPALRATRVPAIAAVRAGAVLPRSRLARLGPLPALTIGAVAVGVLAYGLFAGGPDRAAARDRSRSASCCCSPASR